MWTTFFRDGGFGMYPTALFGFLLVASGVLCLLRPERRFVLLALSLGVVTAGSGVLSFCVGLATTFHYIQHVPLAERFTIAALGCAESLNNLVLALILVVLAAVLTALAAARAALASRAAGAH